MKVRAVETGWIYNQLRIPGTKTEEFELVDIEHSVNKDANGKPVIITKEQQFSKRWMVKVRRKPGPKTGKARVKHAARHVSKPEAGDNKLVS